MTISSSNADQSGDRKRSVAPANSSVAMSPNVPAIRPSLDIQPSSNNNTVIRRDLSDPSIVHPGKVVDLFTSAGVEQRPPQRVIRNSPRKSPVRPRVSSLTFEPRRASSVDISPGTALPLRKSVSFVPLDIDDDPQKSLDEFSENESNLRHVRERFQSNVLIEPGCQIDSSSSYSSTSVESRRDGKTLHVQDWRAAELHETDDASSVRGFKHASSPMRRPRPIPRRKTSSRVIPKSRTIDPTGRPSNVPRSSWTTTTSSSSGSTSGREMRVRLAGPVESRESRVVRWLKTYEPNLNGSDLAAGAKQLNNSSTDQPIQSTNAATPPAVTQHRTSRFIEDFQAPSQPNIHKEPPPLPPPSPVLVPAIVKTGRGSVKFSKVLANAGGLELPVNAAIAVHDGAVEDSGDPRKAVPFSQQARSEQIRALCPRRSSRKQRVSATADRQRR